MIASGSGRLRAWQRHLRSTVGALLIMEVVALGGTPARADAVAAQTTGGTAAPCASLLPRPQDQLWLVSDRGLGCAEADSLASNLRYWRYQPGAGWSAATSNDFFASDDPAAVTVVWAHGNRVEHNYAFEVGWTAYAALARSATDERPLRFVIWSWPSDRVEGGQRLDVRTKAARTGPSARHLARLLNAISPDVRVSLIGYSFGARIVTGALHLTAGGSLNGPPLPASPRPLYDVVLMAAAVDSDWILPGHCHGRALQRVDRLLLFRNNCDEVLKHYHLLYGLRSDAEALGFVGLPYGNLAHNPTRISTIEVCCNVGPEHNWKNYFGSALVVRQTLNYIFPQPTALRANAGRQSPRSAPEGAA